MAGGLAISKALHKQAYREDGEGLFIRECRDWIRDNDFKLKVGRFRLDSWNKFLSTEGG